MSMFCFQCQETAANKGCTVKGVCGKEPSTAQLQDLLLFAVKGVFVYSSQIRKTGKIPCENYESQVLDALFSTITNANFSNEVLIQKIKNCIELREHIKGNLKNKHPVELDPKYENTLLTTWQYENDEQAFSLAEKVGVLRTENEDIRSLKELIIYGLKGISAYAEHALNLGYRNPEIIAFMEKTLLAIEDENVSVERLVDQVFQTGKLGVDAMALLDSANTGVYGHPEITQISLKVGTNPGILISGHDLKDLEQLLEQTQGAGVDVYSHCEMLPANYYPFFKKYDHFIGNYGGSWWHQVEDIQNFGGPVLFTSNCIVPPRGSALPYMDRIFTTNSAGLDGAKHIVKDMAGKKDFSDLIQKAKSCEPPQQISGAEDVLVGGFAWNQLSLLAGDIINGIKTGAIKQFVVMSGCDGRMKSREYYTEYAESVPQGTFILTSGCAKFRYMHLSSQTEAGIPKVLDAGQCNDSYSLALIALKLKEELGLEDINQLPIHFNVAWYEQKAVTVLLALLYLGFKNIHVGPTVPAFLSPNILNYLVENTGLGTIGIVKEDIARLSI